MKAKKSHIRLRELFRKNLEFAEVTPGEEVKAKLMRRVARREFLHFDPFRFNIFYLGAIAGVIITASALLFTGSPDNDKAAEKNAVEISESTGYFEVAVEQPLTLKPESGPVLPLRNKTSAGSPIIVNSGNTSESESGKEVISSPGSISHSFSGNGIFDGSKSDGKKLKVRNESEGFAIFPMPSSGCAPLKVQYSNIADSYDSCIWTLGDGGFSSKKDPEWIYDLEGEYKVSLQVFKDNKILSATATVLVHPRPKAHFEISPEKAIPSNDEVRFLNYSKDAQRFLWDFGDGNASDVFEPTHVYARSSNYNVRLIVYSEWGCTDSLTVYNALEGSEFFIDFPNAFIPNEHGPSGGYFSSKSDEAAQVFHPSFSGVTEYQLKIFSKHGIPIFESNDINLGWDGYNKDQLCDAGVYIWKVRGKFRNGEPFIQMGDVTLLKNQ